MKKGLVTVVLSIYKVEEYLDRCIKSVVEQTYTDLEILLIDDGSSDGCPQKCDDWAQRDSRIRVIHKQNEGLGMARNTGIDSANGEYICFFDSDDYIAPDTIESAYSLALDKHSEIVIFGYNKVDNNGRVISSFIPCNKPEAFFEESVLNDFFPDFMAPSPYKKEPRRFYMSAWVLMYSTEMIKRANWHFVSEREIILEDVYSMLTLFKHVKSVAVLPKALYFYCDNGASLSRVYRSDRYEQIKRFYLKSLEVCKKLQYDDEIVHRVSKPYVSCTIAAMKQECAFQKNFIEALNVVKLMAGDELLQIVLRKNKKDIVSITRRILFFTIRNRLYLLTTILLILKANA